MQQDIGREDYLLATRRRAVETCKGILAGTVDVLEGCHLLASLRWELGVDAQDQDFVTFTAISSEIDALPVGDVRRHWSPAALAALEPELQAASAWALPLALEACRSVVERFGDSQG